MTSFVRPSEIFKPVPSKRRRRHAPKPRPRPRPRPKGNPRDTWPSWVDADRWTIASPDEAPAYIPTPAAEAWNLGFELGYQHDDDARPSADLPEVLTLSWWHGRNVGWLQREEDDAAIDRAALRHGDPITDRDVHPFGVC